MAKQIVAGELYEGITGKLFELGRQIRQKSGYPFDPEKLDRYLQNAIEGKFDGVSVPVFVYDKTKDGWKLLENTPRQITSMHDLELVSFLKQGENSVNGEEMVRRARVELNANYGQEDAEWVLEHQDEIPVEFRAYYLVFTGTVWQFPRGYRRCAFLRWSGERWCLRFFWLDFVWRSGARLVRLRK